MNLNFSAHTRMYSIYAHICVHAYVCICAHVDICNACMYACIYLVAVDLINYQS